MTLIYAAAKGVKPGALIAGQSPNPYFAGLQDMVRLGDIYRHRAATVLALALWVVVRQRPAGERRYDEVCDVLGFVGWIKEQVPTVDISPGEFAVHRASRTFVSEPVALSCRNASDASLKRR